MAPRRTPYSHNASPPQPDAQVDGLPVEEKIDPFVQSLNPPGIDALEVHLDEPEVIPAEPKKLAPEPQIELAEPEPEPQPKKDEPQKLSADDEAYIRLKSQLDRERQARESAHKRAEQLESERLLAQERFQREQDRVYALEQDHLNAQEVAISNAIAFAESQAAQAQREITRALSEGDYDAVGNAHRALARAESDLSRLKEGKTAIEAQKQQPVPRQDPTNYEKPSQPQTQYDRIEAYITQPAHSLRAQQYMRDHYDDLFRDFDNGAKRLSKLVAGHWGAKADGVIEGSDAYFDHLDRHMGYAETPQDETPKLATQPAPAPKKHIPPSAPVSRGQSNNSVSGNSITLSPAMVQFCRESGIDPKSYAREMLRAQKGASDPTYNGPRFSGDMK